MQTLVAVPAGDLHEVPSAVGLDVAATLAGAGMSALQMCSMAQVGPGQRILVNGASGGVGGFAVQIARIRGADVTGTGSSASQPMIRELGARCVDYADPVERWGGPFDAVLDCAARLAAGDQARVLAEGGRYVSTLPAFPSLLFDPLRNLYARRQRHTLRLRRNADDLRLLLAWAEQGRLAPRIAEHFAFDRLIAALVRLRDGHPRGKLLLTVG
jgi:NADPH:quinone reductase-like Zn-dependent oxidoreductase